MRETVIRIPLTRKQIEFDRAVESFPVVLFGGGRGGGKSHGLRSIMLKRRFKYPKSIGYLFRKTYPELYRNHIAPLFKQFPELQRYYNEGKKSLNLPNGSELVFAYCEHARDLAKFQGLEIHDLGIEEAGDWDEGAYQFLKASNRSATPGVPARCLLTANPAGLGHKWLKRLFIEKRYSGKEKSTDYHFIPSLAADNPALEKNDPDYVARLHSLRSETLRRAWIEGDWNVEAGVFFDVRREIHLVPKFKIPTYWQWFGAYDYGFGHPACFGWFAVDEDGNVYLVRFLGRAGMHIDTQAAEVHKIEKELIASKQKASAQTTFWAGHDCWVSKKAGGPTIAEDFMNPRVVGSNIVNLKPANIARKQGASQIRQHLRFDFVKERRVGPRFFILDTEENAPVVDCLSRMVHDPDDIEDVLKVDAQEGDIFTGDDPYDMVRYGLMSRPVLAIAPRKSRSTTYNDEEKPRKASWQTV